MAGVEPRGRGRHDAVFAVVLVIAGLVLLGVTWATAHLGGRENVFVVLLVGLAAAVAAVAAGIWRKRSWWATALSAAGALALTFVLAALTLNGTVAAAKVQPQLDELKAMAESLLADLPPATERCWTKLEPPRELPGVGMLNAMCVTSYAEVDRAQLPASGSELHDHVAFSGREGSVVYQPTGEASPMSSCLAHVTGPWWETQPAEGNCPTGFRFLAGG